MPGYEAPGRPGADVLFAAACWRLGANPMVYYPFMSHEASDEGLSICRGPRQVQSDEGRATWKNARGSGFCPVA